MQGFRRLRSLSALLVFALLLCTPWCVQAGSSGAPRAEAAVGLGLFLDWLAGLWADAGCTFDPGGACRDAAGGPATGSDSLDAGCTFGPNGGACDRAANRDNGCSFDPNGGGCRGDV
jgi:hypothetical protein